MTMNEIRSLYHHGEKLTMVTAYDYTMARIIDHAGIDMILVGDSLGNVIQGEANTLPVNIEHVVYHTRCVAKGVKRAHITADMPFMSYQVSMEEAIDNAGQLVKAGAESIKIEGGEEMADLVWYLNRIGIPVVGHLGLKPQSIHTLGGYRVQGKSKVEADEIFNDAKVFEESGASLLVLESIPTELAKEITESVKIPTIGIGSGPQCSGQVLVIYDLIGADPDFKPRFVKNYMNLNDSMGEALQNYISEVKAGTFPGERESVHRNLVEVKAVKKDK
jgi:3-methyl-2-oxobutanoate hydroxymethyltransferase